MIALPRTVIWGVVAASLTILSAASADPAASRDETGKTTGNRKPPPTSQPATSAPVEWKRPRSTDRRLERQRMVDHQIRSRAIKSPRVLEAMGNVPRHWFVPRSEQRFAYADHPLPIGHQQTISQPYIVALMTEALEIHEGNVVLEVGTGSGYQAAVLAELTPHVYTIEIVEPLCDRAAETFEKHGYETIRARCGDGYAGWPEVAPFDAIIVTCRASRVPPALVQQLKPGGRLCMPVGGQGNQRLLLVTRREDGLTESRSLAPVRFVPMTGDVQKKR